MAEFQLENRQEIPRNAFIEIVHADRDDVFGWQDFRGDPQDVARAIIALEQNGYTLHYYSEGDPSLNLPDLSKDIPIVLGGGILEECVQLRVDAYKAAGFTSVLAYEDISLKAIYNEKNRARQSGR